MMTTSRQLGIYVHIPYCIRKCSYCDFLSFEKERNTDCEIDAYIHGLSQEIAMYGMEFEDAAVDTIFIGGGTPSAIDASHISHILDGIRENYILEPDAEITIEVNPGTLTEEKLKSYRNSGINRLSMGVQSMNDDVLKNLGRIHSVQDARESLKMAREAGFENISMDLMFAVPGLTMEIWEDTLKQAVELGPEHISFYSLQIEDGTLFAQMADEGLLKETEEELDREMYHFAIEYLKENGYHQYEISNAAKKGFYSRHNMKYWSMDEYLGLGLGASSYIRPYISMAGEKLHRAGFSYRSTNCTSIPEYIQGVSEQKMLGGIHVCGCTEEIYENTLHDDASEFVFTGLRRTKGIDLEDFHVFTGRHFFQYFSDTKEKIGEWRKQGLVSMDKKRETYGDERDFSFRLTESGFDISNIILREFV